ncbi:hypothetical protein PSY15_24265, partial [Shigella flexneri]|nr:hypothetical protein [Shigella flexneri]
MTLAYGKALKDEVIARIAAKHNASNNLIFQCLTISQRHIGSDMTLAYGKALKDEVIARIAAKHNASN